MVMDRALTQAVENTKQYTDNVFQNCIPET